MSALDTALSYDESAARRLALPGARLVGSCLKARWRFLLPGVVVAAGYTAFRVAVPLLLRSLVDTTVSLGSSGMRRILALAGAVLLAGAAQSVFAGLRRYSAIRLAIRIQTDLRQRLFEHYQRLSFSFHDSVQIGQLMARANSDAEQVQNLVVYIPLTLANLATFVAAIVFLFWIDPAVGMSALLVLPLITLAARALTVRISPKALTLQRMLAELTQIVEEAFRGIRVIKALGKESRWRERFEEASDRAKTAALEVASVRATYAPLVAALSSLAPLAVLLTGGSRISQGRASIGDLLAAMFFVQLMSWPLQLMGDLAAQAQRTFIAAGRIAEILEQDLAVAEDPRAEDVPLRGGEIVFENVSFSYREDTGGRPLLRGLSFKIDPGEKVAIVGPTGSGKSTIAALIPRFYDVSDGAVYVDGVDVRRHRLSSLRARIAVVFEDNFLFTDTIYNNIAYGKSDVSREKVEWAARLARADEFIKNLPLGYDTLVGEQGVTLSGGQRQRLAIARALLKDPEILILDSPTSAVDARVEAELVDALRQAIEGRTTIIVTDRLNTLLLADRILYVEQGRLVAEGTMADLRESVPGFAEIIGFTASATSGAKEGGGSGTPAQVKVSESDPGITNADH